MSRMRIAFIVCLVLVAGIATLYYNNDFKEEKNNKNFVRIEPKNVYFDLGANNGDSVDNFLDVNIKSHGGDIRSKIPAERLKQKWIIHAIEGNSAFDLNLFNLKTKYKQTEHKILVYNGTIVTNYDGFITFYIDENNRYGNHVGSSILENHPDVVLSKKVNVKKPCVDLARLLRFYTQSDFVVVKMDIEGAEFELLIHLIKENVLNLIDIFIVEYHRTLSPFKTSYDVFSAIFKRFNIQEEIWN